MKNIENFMLKYFVAARVSSSATQWREISFLKNA
jgi:hypothetical protein